MHYKTTQFKQVQAKDGGIVRTIHVESLDINVEDVLNYGRDIFFEGGYSKYGRIEDMDVTLGDCIDLYSSLVIVRDNRSRSFRTCRALSAVLALT